MRTVQAAKPQTRLLLLVTGARSTSVGRPGLPLGDMTMLCATVLLAAAAGACRALRPRRATSTGELCADRVRPAIVRLLVDRAGTGPPYVWEFSVVRC